MITEALTELERHAQATTADMLPTLLLQSARKSALLTRAWRYA